MHDEVPVLTKYHVEVDPDELVRNDSVFLGKKREIKLFSIIIISNENDTDGYIEYSHNEKSSINYCEAKSMKKYLRLDNMLFYKMNLCRQYFDDFLEVIDTRISSYTENKKLIPIEIIFRNRTIRQIIFEFL